MAEKTKFTPPPVSRFYIYDWQYAVDIYKATALQFISLLIILIPVVIDSEKIKFISVPRGLLIAAVAFLVDLIFFYFFCPRFIREYRDYGQYKKREGSHRWILWEFYNNLKSLSGWKTIVEETVSKGLTVELSQYPNIEIRTELEKSFTTNKNKGKILEGKNGNEIRVFQPVNINRDLYLPILLEDQRLILYMEEDDKKLAEKEKEMFWILYSQAAKEKVVARAIFWILIFLTVISFVLSLPSIFLRLI